MLPPNWLRTSIKISRNVSAEYILLVDFVYVLRRKAETCPNFSENIV